MTPVTQDTTQPHHVKVAASGKGRPARNRGLVAQLGWDLSDLSAAVYHTQETVGSSLLVGGIFAGSTR